MTKLLSILILTCATLHAQSVILQASSAGNVRGTGGGNVRGTAFEAHAEYSDGRFWVFDANTNVVLDTDSGIQWMRDANIADSTMDWTNAVNYCANLTNATYSDWRLPDQYEISRGGSVTGLLYIDQLPSPALPAGHPFTNLKDDIADLAIWTSTIYSEEAAQSVYVYSGDVVMQYYIAVFYVWPCRGP